MCVLGIREKDGQLVHACKVKDSFQQSRPFFVRKVNILNNLCLLERENIPSNKIVHFALKKLINFNTSLLAFLFLVSNGHVVNYQP